MLWMYGSTGERILRASFMDVGVWEREREREPQTDRHASLICNLIPYHAPL